MAGNFKTVGLQALSIWPVLNQPFWGHFRVKKKTDNFKISTKIVSPIKEKNWGPKRWSFWTLYHCMDIQGNQNTVRLEAHMGWCRVPRAYFPSDFFWFLTFFMMALKLHFSPQNGCIWGQARNWPWPSKMMTNPWWMFNIVWIFLSFLTLESKKQAYLRP